jgi:hypothetical protein
MFRRTLIAALLLMGAPILLSCQATESVTANSGSTFRDRGLEINSIQTAARTPRRELLDQSHVGQLGLDALSDSDGIGFRGCWFAFIACHH